MYFFADMWLFRYFYTLGIPIPIPLLLLTSQILLPETNRITSPVKSEMYYVNRGAIHIEFSAGIMQLA